MTPMRVGPFELETLRIGDGPPVLLIHGINPIHPDSPFLAKLASIAVPPVFNFQSESTLPARGRFRRGEANA